MSPTFHDHDEQACFNAGRSFQVPCASCGELHPDGQLNATSRGLICDDCHGPNHTISAEDWKRSIAANRRAPNLVLERIRRGILAA